MTWNWDHAWAALPLLLDGFKITLLATVLGTLIAAILGLLLAVAQRVLPRVLSAPLMAVAGFIRMTPLVVQLVFANLVFSQFSALTVGIVVLGPVSYTHLTLPTILLV